MPIKLPLWKRQLMEGAAGLFDHGRPPEAGESEAREEKLYEQIGRLKMEVEWLKKNLPSSAKERRRCIDFQHRSLSVRRQCELLGVPRSMVYYEPISETTENLRWMRQIDEQYLKTPLFGSRQMVNHFAFQGHRVNRKRIQWLMRIMGLQATGPHRRTTVPNQNHRVFPYLLRDVEVNRVNQVWGTDITYIPLRRGFLYLIAVLDWYSRYVLSWRLGNTMETSFCLAALESSLAVAKPEIFNTDQGSQFTSNEFTGRLLEIGVAVSMAGKGRVYDNILVERLWRTVKYKEVYLHDYVDGGEADERLRVLSRKATTSGSARRSLLRLASLQPSFAHAVSAREQS